MAEEYKPQSVYIANEDKRRRLLRLQKQMEASGDVAQPRQLNDIFDVPIGHAAGALFENFVPSILHPNLGTVALAGGVVAGLVFGPEIFGALALDEVVTWAIPMFAGEIGGAALEKAADKLAPNHPGIKFAAGLIGNVMGGLAGDPASLKYLAAKFGPEAVKELGETVFKNSPEQLELFEKAVADPGSEEAISKLQQANKIRQSEIQAKRQAEELATKTRLPPEQIKMEEELRNKFPLMTDEMSRQLGLESPEPEQGALFGEKPEFDSESYQGSTGKIVPEQEQLPFDFENKIEQLILNIGKDLGATGKKEALGKVQKLIEVTSWSGFLKEGMYDAVLWIPRLPEVKLLSDAINLPVQIVARSMGVAIEHGPMAGINSALAAAYGHRQAWKDALKYGYSSLKEDSPMYQKFLGMEKDAAYGSDITGNIRFSDSAMGKGLRYIWAGFGASRRAIMGADQFAKVVARSSSRRMGAYIEALNEADKKGLVGAAKLLWADGRAENLFHEVGTDTAKKLDVYANKKMFEYTFTDTSNLVKRTGELIDKVPALRAFVQFLSVPAALIKQGVAFLPGIGVASSAFRQGFTSPDKIEQDAAIAKWAVTGMAMHSLWHMAAESRLIGNGPSPGSPNRDTWEHRNHRNSIKIGDHYYGFEHLGPPATILSFAADTHDMFSQTDDHAYKEKLTTTMQELFADRLTDTPVLKQMFNVTHAVDSWKHGGAGKAATEFINQEATEIIPGVVREAAQIEDPVTLNARTTIEAIKANVPGYSKDVYPKRNRFGYAQTTPVGSGPANSASKIERLLNTVSPVPLEGDTDIDPVDKELYKYGIKFDPIPDHISHGRGPSAVTMHLTETQQDEWARQAGHGLILHGHNQHDAMQALIQSKEYQNLPPNRQAERLAHIATQYRAVAEPKPDHAAVHRATAQMKSMGGGELGKPIPPMQITKSMEEMKAGDSGGLPPSEVTAVPSTGEAMPTGALPPTEVK